MSMAFQGLTEIYKYRKAQISGFAQAQDGMCHGMCLDWIRRILKGQKCKHSVVPDYKKFDVSDPSANDQTQSRWEKKQSKITIIQGLAASRMNLSFEKEEEANLAQVETYAAFREDYFKAFCHNEEALAAKSPEKFSFKEIMGSIVPNPYTFLPDDFDGGPGVDWGKVRSYIKQKTRGGACYLVLITSASHRDHAVAFYKEFTGEYRFMDPNCGEFAFEESLLADWLEIVCSKQYGVSYLGINEFSLSA
jgi:hypothetical protein